MNRSMDCGSDAPRGAWRRMMTSIAKFSRWAGARRGFFVAACLVLPKLAFGQGPAEKIEYYHLDAVGSVRLVTDEQRNMVAQYDYLPFGEVWESTAQGDVPRKFAGKERDSETGLEYFGARYYASGTGRFTTVDPSLDQLLALGSPQRWNRYAYGLNNPLRFVDPDGRDVWDYIAGIGNAIKSNLSFGVGRQTPTNSDYELGQFAGDLMSIPIGSAEANGGITIAGAGVVAEGPSLGSSTVAVVAGGAMVVQGATAASAGIVNAGTYWMKKTGGVTSSGQATDEYGNKLGPSGKPQINTTTSNTREGARNKALDQGSGAVEHRSPKEGRPHFHPTDKNGQKKPTSTHHEYPED
jgi:RHS repeat-associated protein